MADITMDKLQDMTGELVEQVTDAMKKAIDELGLATKDDIKELKDEIASLTIETKS